MTVTTGLSGNEIYCLSKKDYRPGNIVVGNSVQSLGFLGSIGSGLKSILGGEITQVSSLISEGRGLAYQRMLDEAIEYGASGITGVNSQLIFHGTNLEFLSIGSGIHGNNHSNTSNFSTCDNGQELYAQLDAGFKPVCFAFGNVVYSLGLRRGILGGLKTLGKGEIKEYSHIFNKTRHMALNRIVKNAIEHNANAVLGIKTTILPLLGNNEMLMIGTASTHADLASEYKDRPITSNLSNVELWSMIEQGYMPQRLLLGTSVYSLGFIGGFTSIMKSFVRGEINELTRMIYGARENALQIINDEAKAIQADDVIGVKTYVSQLGNGLIEFLAIGTAVKKTSMLKTLSPTLPPQAIINDKSSFYDANNMPDVNVNVNNGNKQVGALNTSIPWVLLVLGFILFLVLKLQH